MIMTAFVKLLGLGLGLGLGSGLGLGLELGLGLGSALQSHDLKYDDEKSTSHRRRLDHAGSSSGSSLPMTLA